MKKAFTSVKLSTCKRSSLYLTGFTLIEILIVVAIIGILSVFVIINVTNSKYRANYSKTMADMDSISKAVLLFAEQYSRFPDDVSGGLIPDDVGFSDYLDRWPTPPCKNGYHYDYENWYHDASPNGGLIGLHYKSPVIAGNSVNLYSYSIRTFHQALYAGPSLANKAQKELTCKEI